MRLIRLFNRYSKITLWNCITLIVPLSMQSIFLSDASAVFPDVITAHLASLRLAGLHCSFGRHVNGCWAGQDTCVKPLF